MKTKITKKTAKKPLKTKATSKNQNKSLKAKTSKKKLPVTYDEVCKAAKRLEGVANKTPVLTSRTLNAMTGAQFFLKCENYQRIGAFKFRGGYNALAQFDEKQRKAGAITESSGNFAQALSLAGKLTGIKATIVMPYDAPKAKVAATRGYGANIIHYERYKINGEALAQKIAKEKGMVYLPSYNHEHVIAGQGTAAKELFDEVGNIDCLFVCVGGGGLISGCSLVAKARNPKCQVYGVEPEAGNDA